MRPQNAGQEGLEPTTAGFGDRCATNCATALRDVAAPLAPASAVVTAFWAQFIMASVKSRPHMLRVLAREREPASMALPSNGTIGT